MSRQQRPGLKNLGNTCYMNAALQCLMTTDLLVDYFLLHFNDKELNRGTSPSPPVTTPAFSSCRCVPFSNQPLLPFSKNRDGTGGCLSSAFKKFVQDMRTNSQTVIDPTDLKRCVDDFAPQFKGFEQHDAQEFLAFFFDGLHEDHNRVSRKSNVAEPDITLKLLQSRGMERLAAESWQRYLLRSKSFLVDLFQGQLRSTITCARCNECSIRFEPFMYLSLPLPQDCSTATLPNLIDSFIKEEQLDFDMMCIGCRHKSRMTKKIDVYKLPPLLILHFKRFAYSGAGFRKIESEIKVPVTAPLDLTSYVKQRHEPLYHCYSFISHRGRFQFGHYTSYCLENNVWRLFDDEMVTPVAYANSPGFSDNFVSYKDIYVAFYRRADLPEGNAPLLRTQSVTRPEDWPHTLHAEHIKDLKTYPQVPQQRR